MNILVIGGTGNTGGQTVQQLIARKARVRVMTSSKEKLSTLPGGTEGAVGNLKDPASLTAAFAGIDRVFLVTPLSPTEKQEGLNAVEAAKKAGVKRIVYMSVHRVEDIPDAPHFADKVVIENAIRSSGIPFTLIRPNNFYQNDYWFTQPMLDYGVYAQPIGNTGIHRVDVQDIAAAAANALLNDGHEGKTYNLVGPEKMTGDETAAIYSQLSGKKIVYAGDDLDAWAKAASAMMPDWMVKDFVIMYRHFQTKGLLATPEHLAETEAITGKKPRKFEDFAREVTSQWK